MNGAAKSLRPGPGVVSLVFLAVLGLALIAWRFWAGLGAVTNLSDGYPWGFWIGIDVLVGIALAAGGFVIAGLVHLFGGRRFHVLSRPAILTALLGYVFFIFALAVDLGRPWNIWVALFSWNHVSPMFEVAWCVMFYTFVLFLEFVPVVFERLGWTRTWRAWREGAPFLVIGMLSLFTFAMTDSPSWAAVTFGLLLLWEILMRAGIMPREHQMPLLLILAGVMLSTMHQSSLGTLFLISDKVVDLWHSPILPLMFFVSAVMVGPAMVVVESVTASRAFGREPELPVLTALGRGMPWLIGAYLVIRIGDVVASGEVLETLSFGFPAVWWWLEIALLVAGMTLFAQPDVLGRTAGLLTAASATVGALIVNRTGVAMVGIQVPEYAAYVPAWQEVAITAGIVSMAILAYRAAVLWLPIMEAEERPRSAASGAARAASRSTAVAGT